MAKRNRHKEFINEYLSNGNNGAKAYMKVYKVKDNDYAAKAAHKLLQLPHVAEMIESERKKIEAKYEISRGAIIKELLDLVEQCKSDEDRNHLLKSLDMMNKMAGNYTEKKEINVKGDGIVFNFVDPTKPEEPKEDK